MNDTHTKRPANALREKLADIEHQQWSSWMTYLFEKSVLNPDGSVTIPAPFVERWKRQINTAYADLSEPEKESDRIEADKFIAVFAAEEERAAGSQREKVLQEKMGLKTIESKKMKLENIEGRPQFLDRGVCGT